MKYVLKERIGDSSLFCRRRQEMELLMNWVEMIPRETAKPRALLGRRKSGKSAIMQRLFNILWNQNERVILFYFEVQDYGQWLLEFADAYYRTLISQYLSFKMRTVLDIDNQPWKMSKLIEMASENAYSHVLGNIKAFQSYLDAERAEAALTWAIGTPARQRRKGFFSSHD